MEKCKGSSKEDNAVDDSTLPSSPLFFFSSEGGKKFFLCCQKGIFATKMSTKEEAEESFSSYVAMLDSDFESQEDVDSGEKKDKKGKEGSSSFSPPELVYKYKSPAASFCLLLRSKLFSLHFKSGLAYVECTDLSSRDKSSSFFPLTCLEPCVARFDLQDSGSLSSCCRSEGPWMAAFPGSEVDERWKAGMRRRSSALVLVKASGTEPCRMLEVHPETGRLVSQQKLEGDSDVRSRLDAHLRVSSAACGVSLKSNDFEGGWILDEEVRAVQRVKGERGGDGVLLILMSSGRLWQYMANEEGGVNKVMLPARDVMLLDVSSDSTSINVMTFSGAIYGVSLPYRPGQKQMQRGGLGDAGTSREVLSESQVVREIGNNLQRLDRLNEKRAVKEEMLDQLRLALLVRRREREEKEGKGSSGFASCRACVRQAESLGGHLEAKVAVEVRNVGRHLFRGRYWRLGISVGRQDGGGAATSCRELCLPDTFSPGDAWTALVPIPDDMRSRRRGRRLCCSINVALDLVFYCEEDEEDGNGSEAVEVKADVADCRLGTIDFLRMVSTSTKAGAAFSAAEVFRHEEDDGDAVDVVRQILSEKEPESRHPTCQTAMQSFHLLLPVEFVINYSWKPFFAELRSLLSQEPKQSWTVECALFEQAVEMTLEFRADSVVSLGVACSDGWALLELKRDLLRLKRKLVLERGRPVRLDKRVLAAAARLREEVEAVSDDETEENRAKLVRCYREVRKRISAKMP